MVISPMNCPCSCVGQSISSNSERINGSTNRRNTGLWINIIIKCFPTRKIEIEIRLYFDIKETS
jgi:hypothetical protein